MELDLQSCSLTQPVPEDSSGDEITVKFPIMNADLLAFHIFAQY